MNTPTKSRKNTDPKVTGSPTSEVRSLMRKGTPENGPVLARSASASAASNRVLTTALSTGFTAS